MCARLGRIEMNCKTGILILAVSVVGGCYSPDPPSLWSDSAPTVIPAIKSAAASKDHRAVPRLIALLDNHDSAVRFAANSALTRITGADMGYCYYGSEADRKAAIARWYQWLNKHPQ